MASGGQNMTTYIAKHIIGDSQNVNWAGALLHSGTGGKTSSMDTWIFADDYGSASSTYGFLHRQSDDKFVFVGGSTDKFWNNLNTGDTYIAGKLGIGTTSPAYTLEVNGTSNFKNTMTITGASINMSKVGEVGIEVDNTQATNPNKVAFIVGSSGKGGIYSRKHDKWIVYADADGNVVLNGNANTATTAENATRSGIATIWMYPQSNNEINFGGTNTGTIIYFGYRAKDSRPIPTKFVFGSSTGTADLQAKTVYLGSGTTSYISATQYTGNAAAASRLNSNTTVSTKSGLQYTVGSLTIGTADGNAKEGSNNSPTLWSYPTGGTAINNSSTANIQNLRLYWGSDSKYFRDIFMSPNNSKIYHRAVANGTAGDWLTILDSGNTYAASSSDISVTWNTSTTIATINGTAIKIKIPANPNSNTTYTFAGGTNSFTVTPSGGTAQTVTVTPSIANNITGSGTANYITKFTGANTIGATGIAIDSNNNLTIPSKVIKFTGLGEGLEITQNNDYFGSNSDARIISIIDTNPGTGSTAIDGGLIIQAVGRVSNTDTIQELLRIRNNNGSADWKTGEFQWKTKDIVVEVGKANKTWNISIAGDAATVNGLTVKTAVPANAVFTDHYAWGDITSKPDTATRWPKWNEIAVGANDLPEGTSNWTDNTEILTSYASNNGFADTNAKGVVYRRDALCAYNYIKGKLDSVYAAKATTLSGYGITDAKIASGVITLGSNTITPITSIADLTGSTITATELRTNLGLTAALRFIGKATTDISESTTTAPTVTGITSYVPEVGDVVLDKNNDAEYVCIAKTTVNNTTTYTWELLGRSGSWATSTHTHGNITNGGLLGAANMAVVTDGSKKITTADLSVSDSAASTNATTTFVQAVTQNAQGKITVTKASLNTSGTWSGTASKATTTANTTDTLYLVGIKSGATSTLLHDTSIAVKGNTLDAGIIKLHQGTAADPSLTGNARIEFDYSGGQPVVISYTPNDGYRSPAGLKVIGGSGATPAWLEVEGNIYAAAFKGNADTASSAAKLTTARNLAVALGSTTAVTFDGSANQTSIPVSGTLGIAHGGTGQTTLTAARQQFSGPEFIVGTWTAASGTWTGTTTDSELYDGKQIILYMPFAGNGNATLNLTLANGTTTGAKNVYFESTTRFTTHKGQNAQLHLIYHSGLKLSNGTTYEGWWYIANRDTDNDYRTRQNVLADTDNSNRSLLLANPVVGTANNNTAYVTYRNDKIYANVNTGIITATGFKGDLTGDVTGNADTATSASQLSTPSLTTEANIENGTRTYYGAGGNWTGTITSMAYAGILQVCGGYSRGWQIWACRGDNATQSLHWRNPNDAANAWNTERIILDSSNYTTYTVASNAGAHNGIYRGKYLGTAVTSAQYSAISNGTFDDLFIGDYWTINSVNWRIAAFDYWYNKGYPTACTTHHVVIVPDSALTSAKMNASNITTGAYIGSDFYTGANGNTGKATMMSAINNAFGTAHILTHTEHLQNATTNGYESGGTWYDSTAELMTERMVYGCDIFHNQMAGSNIPNWYSIDTSQLPLFRYDHSRSCINPRWWLRDVVGSWGFAAVQETGNAHHGNSGTAYGIRPAFAIKA